MGTPGEVPASPLDTERGLVASGVDFGYGRRGPLVLRDFTWRVTPGARTLLLGPNGAGKSTLLRVLSGQARPRRGMVTVDGESGRRALFGRVGWMPQDIRPLRGFTVREQVEFAAWAGGTSAETVHEVTERALAAVRLEQQSQARASRLSGGQLRRLGLAQVLARDSDVMLLDEPTAGLDPAQTINFREILREVDVKNGVVVSTHQVSDLIEDVDRVAVLVDGSIRFDGTVAEFASRGTGRTDPDSLARVFMELAAGGLH